MTVPEAPVNEDDFLEPPEHDVRLAGQLSRMQAVTKASPVQHSTNDPFRTCVALLN
jgi:hypothetical protein